MEVWRKQCLLAYVGILPYQDIDDIWGDQTQGATEAFQSKYQMKPVDGIFGDDTLEKILDVIHSREEPAPDISVGDKKEPTDKDVNVPTKTGTFWDEIEYFTPDEFKCKCGGKYCKGYPHEPDERMVRTVNQLRKNLGVPITIVSGLRCKTWNAIQGGVSNSQHMYGEAADIYAKGVSQSRVEAELDKIGGVRYHYAIKGSSNVHFDVPKGNR